MVPPRHGQPALGRLGFSRRRLVASGSVALAAAAMPGLGRYTVPPAVAQDDQVIIQVGGGAWEAAQDIAYFQPFQEETGIEVVRVPPADIGQLRAMVETGNVTFDCDSGAGASSVYTYAEEGLLQPIDYSYFDQETLDGFAPEGVHEYGVASLFYSVVLGINTDTFPEGPTTWAEFWDRETFPGPRSLGTGQDGGQGTWEIALMADGVPVDELYPIDFERALASLDRVRDDIVDWWDIGGLPAQLLTDGQVDLTSAWNGRMQALIDEGLPVAINWNQGILQWDLQWVPKGAPHPENAMQLLAFMSRADRQAVFAENIAYAPANTLAYELIPEERAAILPTAPELMEQQFLQDYAFWNSTDEASGRKMIDVAAEHWNTWLLG